MIEYVDFCRKCKTWMDEKLLDFSHDIPKYMGGTDLNGRHKLCKTCHDKYEKEIILGCLRYFDVDWEDDKDSVYYMVSIKEQCEVPLYKTRCQFIAKVVAKKWFQ